MMRSLLTAASGMTTQQMNVDTISNNLANVNTKGYKKERVEFKSLLYETMTKAGIDENGQGKPVNLQVGHGVKPVATVKMFTAGPIEKTDNPLDFAISGSGFFAVRDGLGNEVYTRDGSFKVALVEDELMLTTSDGMPVLDTEDELIVLGSDIDISNLNVDSQGSLSYMDSNDNAVDLNIRVKVVQFKNVAGLEAIGNNTLEPTSASGEPILEADNDEVKQSSIVQRSLEGSNVQVVEEMVNLIVAQRAFEISSKAIQTSDEMLSQANNLKR